MIHSIGISNFKCITNAEIKIKPITILCGPNSSGKSSLSQSLLLLKQTYSAIGGMHTLTPNGNLIDLGSFQELIRNHDLSNLLQYHIILDYVRDRYSKNKGHFLRDTSLRRNLRSRFHSTNDDISLLDINIDYNYQAEQEKITLDRVVIKEHDDFFIESRKNKTGTYRFAYGEILGNKKPGWSNPNLTSLTDFLSPQLPKDALLQRSLSEFKSQKLYYIRTGMRRHLSTLANEFEDMNYLGPFRQVPNRYYMTGGAMPSDIGYRGESSVAYLSYMKVSGERKIIDFVSYWLKRLNYASQFDVKTIKDFIKSVVLTNNISNVESSLIDVGFGISQVLPVIIAVCRHKYGIHIFEQPEIHLHPKSQSDIADLFIENSNSDKSFIIETHSEHLIHRMRRRVSEGKLNPNNIQIYYVDSGSKGSSIRPISIDNNGAFLNFPTNFFDEAYQESRRIVEAGMNRRASLSHE